MPELATVALSGEKRSEVTSLVCPWSTRLAPEATSQRRTVRSKPPVATVRPSGLTSTAPTVPS